MATICPGKSGLIGFTKARAAIAIVLAENRHRELPDGSRRSPIWELTIIVSPIDGIDGIMPPADGLTAVTADPFVDAELYLLTIKHWGLASSVPLGR